MPIHFKELETILHNWKTYSINYSQDNVTQGKLKERMISQIMNLFESMDCREIRVSEEANLDRTYGKIKYENIIRIITVQKAKL